MPRDLCQVRDNRQYKHKEYGTVNNRDDELQEGKSALTQWRYRRARFNRSLGLQNESSGHLSPLTRTEVVVRPHFRRRCCNSWRAG